MSTRPEVITDVGTTISWIVTDLDGTIVGRDLRLVERSVAALEAFRRDGGEVYIATGRNEVSALPFYRRLGLDTPAILYNGARITDLSTGERLLDRKVDSRRRSAVRVIMPRLSDRFGVSASPATRRTYCGRRRPWPPTPTGTRSSCCRPAIAPCTTPTSARS